jgi:hypothetical protein
MHLHLKTKDFEWRGDKLMFGARNTKAKIIPDSMWPGMWRVEYPAGVISDMTNLSRAHDAAIYLVMDHLNRTHTARASAAMQGCVESKNR